LSQSQTKGFTLVFSRQTLHRYIKRCLKWSAKFLRESQQIKSAFDIETRLNQISEEAHEMFAAAREVLLVDGVLDLNPRDWKVRVHYKDHNDTNREGDLRCKVATLEELLARLEGEGFAPTRFIFKAKPQSFSPVCSTFMTEPIP